MAQQFVGRVEFQDSANSTRLFVDPDSPAPLTLVIASPGGDPIVSLGNFSDLDRDGHVIVSNRDGSRVITMGDAGGRGNVSMPNDCSAVRYFASGRPDLDGTVIVSNRDGSRVITIGDANGNGNVSMPNDCGAKRFFANDVFLTNSDCAEEFDLCGGSECAPGTVVVIDEQGAVRQSEQAYDRRVAGVISGAGDYKPGIVLDRRLSSAGRAPVALVGKVYCMVDAQYSSIEVGDLLTTSPTPGHAMRADDPIQAFGAVIGKALRALERGQALVPILIALQ